jgi:hypothetical protein
MAKLAYVGIIDSLREVYGAAIDHKMHEFILALLHFKTGVENNLKFR